MTSQAKKANEANQSALNDVRRSKRLIALVDVTKRSATSEGDPTGATAMSDDPLHALTDKGAIIEAPFDMLTLAMLPEYSSELGQCVEAMQVNIEGFGHRQVPRVKTADKKAPEALKREVERERVRLANFFEYCTVESFIEFRKKLRKDLETTGNAYFEVIRDNKGNVQSFHHVPSYQMRLSRQDDELTEVDRPILALQEDGEVTVDKVKELRRFRRFLQCRSIQRRNLTLQSNQLRWFKSFGDTRIWNNETGEIGNDATPANKRANEMIHLSIYSARSPYGLPRFIGNLLSIYGDRASEEINYTTFRNNNIPSMVVCVSNGQLTDGSIDRIEKFVEAQIQGSDNYSKFLLLEGETSSEDGEDGGQVRIDVKPLTAEQHADALFQKYSANNQDKIRRSFRLPPILVGKAEEYTRATAEASIRLADEQVFAPERDTFDALMNRVIYPAMGIRFHKFKSNSPNTTDNETLVGLLAGAEKTGGMTPRIARAMLAGVLSEEWIQDDFPEDFDADKPFSLSMAEAVKNKADPAEPGQQVTALKALLGSTELPAGADPLTTYLVEINKLLEGGWRQEVFRTEADAGKGKDKA